jgi:hypothetical protein
MKQYITESALRAQKNQKEFTLFKRIIVSITDPLPDEINIKSVLKDIEKKVPEHILSDVDSVYIGNYKMLQDRQVDSLYVNGSILITNQQPSDKELFSTIIHELGHASEEVAKDFIYGDGKLAREFIAKRKTLFNLLKDDYEINQKDFVDINFNQNFDDFAYKIVGYDNLGLITNGLFVSPYGCTSLREYFANGFEHYFLKDSVEVRELSPVLYRKIREILRGDYLNN